MARFDYLTVSSSKVNRLKVTDTHQTWEGFVDRSWLSLAHPYVFIKYQISSTYFKEEGNVFDIKFFKFDSLTNFSVYLASLYLCPLRITWSQIVQVSSKLTIFLIFLQI